MVILKYDLRVADENGFKEHPEVVLKNIGYDILDYVPEPMSDSIFVIVHKAIEPLPPFLSVSNYEPS